jgi:thioredoxin
MIVTCPNCGAKNRVDEQAALTQHPLCGRCGQNLPSADAGLSPLEITDSTFEQVLSAAGDKPVLIDFWAAWCPPCRLLAPTIEQLAAEATGRYLVGKLDTDANQATAARFNITGIPTMLIFKRGQLIDRIVGLAPKQAIAAKIAQHV